LLVNALSQAKSKYKYVIAERNDDYRKELKDLYSDVKVFTDSLGSACESLSKGLITDLLSIGFIFSLTMFARIALNKQELLFSPQISLLFNLIAGYLIIAFIFRFWNARKSLTFAETQFDEWSKRLHNHISSDEIKTIKSKMTVNPIAHFESVSAIVGALHLLLAFGITQVKALL
jgi:signal transduction histidine kinase